MKRSVGSTFPSVMGDAIKNGDGCSSTSRSVTTTVNGSHNFVIQGFSLTKGMGVGRRISSETFFVGGYQWVIYFYPDGNSAEDEPRYSSCFLALASEDRNVRAVNELTLLDQSGQGKDKTFHGHWGPGRERRPFTFKARGSMCGCERRPFTFKDRGSMCGCERFFRRASLINSKYLKDDCLKLRWTVGVVTSASEYAGLHSISVPESELGLQFGALLENHEASDVIFDVAGEKFHAHKLVLAARSPVFRAKFVDCAEQNNEVTITEMEPTVFKAMLHYIYTDTLLDEDPSSPGSSSSSITETLTERLLAVADAYGLRRLMRLCESKLCRRISVDTVASTLALAHICHATDLKAVCLKFAAQNLGEVVRTKGFEYLKEKCHLVQLELLNTVAHIPDDCSSEESRRTVKSQLNDDTDINGRRVKPKA